MRADVVLDAVPKGGAVRFIRQPDAPAERLDELLGAARPRAAARRTRGRVHDDAAPARRSRRRRAPPPRPTPSRRPASGSGRANRRSSVRDLVRMFGDFTAVAGRRSTCAAARSSDCSDPMAPARPRRSACSVACLPATSGHLEVAGVNLRTARAQARARIGYVSQKFALYGELERAREPRVLRRRVRTARPAPAARVSPRPWSSSD